MTAQERRVGIVMLLYNRADVAVPCLRSLARAAGETPWELFLVDNASRPEEAETVRREFERLVAEGALVGELVRSETNLGFPGGNNLGLRRLLARADLTHLCLLNSDVVVTDHWLDRLLERDADAVGPVTNACGNEQTVPVPRLFEPGEEVLEVANAWSEERRRRFRGHTKQTDFLGFFCFLARIELFYRVGFLDERFGRGAFEDDDFCLRARALGFRMAVARDVFVYHWGTASFRQMRPQTLSRMLRRNRRLLVEKTGAPWKDRALLPLVGAWDDMESLGRNAGEDEAALARRHAEQSLEYTRFLVEQTRQTAAWPFGRARRLLQRVGGRWRRSRPRRALSVLGELLTRKPVLVLGRWYPREEDLSDGYFQRVQRIDGVLADHCRVYLRTERMEQRRRLAPSLRRVGLRAYELGVDTRNPLQALLGALLALRCRRVYVHSVLRFHHPVYQWLYRLASARVLDLHGAVPEEFETEGDPEHAREYGAHEAAAVRRATALVVVSEAMAEHLAAKYGTSPRRRVVCLPMLPGGGRWAAEDPAAERRGVIYAGGLHPWQQLDKMLDYAGERAAAGPFTFLVTRPDEVAALWRERHPDAPPPTIARVPSAEVPDWYARHAFGFVLRQPVVLNAVACPTKLVEYLQSGLVPIVDSPQIGDFPRLGYRYVRLDEPLPDEAERRQMAAENRGVLRKLYLNSLLGEEELRAWLRDPSSSEGTAEAQSTQAEGIRVEPPRSSRSTNRPG